MQAKSFVPPTGESPLTCINLLGNLGRNTVIGPGLFNVDFSMVKDNHIRRISEAFHIQFRAEFFNILNHANFTPPIDNLVPFDPTGAPVPGFGPARYHADPGTGDSVCIENNLVAPQTWSATPADGSYPPGPRPQLFDAKAFPSDKIPLQMT